VARRARTAKQLAPRIEIDYFKKPHPLRRARFALSLAGVVIAAVWLLGLAAAKSHGVYSPGPVSDPHAFIGQKCELCHLAQGPGLRKARLKVSDQACLACHDGPEHQSSVPASNCASCHAEHQGRLTQIVHVRDVDCAKCHATLDPGISRFNKDHPEFGALKSPSKATIRLNHKAHLAQSLTCDTCHHTGVVDPTTCKPVGANCVRPSDSLALMVPVTYKDDCQACHDALNFQTAFGDTAPHDAPEKVDAWFKSTHPGDGAKLQVAEVQLWVNGCSFCHVGVQLVPGSLPKIAPAHVAARWFDKAVFSHDAHRSLDCLTCHASISNSEKAEQVDLPSVHTCQSCHQPQRVESACFGCHVYHDWTKEKAVPGKITTKQIAGLGAGKPANNSIESIEQKTLSADRR
jgi:cytochrome c7-like protein